MQIKLRVRLKKSVDDSYDIHIGMNLEGIAAHIASLNLGSTYFIVTDSNVHKLYGKKFLTLLTDAGVTTHIISFPAGEVSKTRATKEFIEDKLLAKKAGRDSVIIGLGGGVVGDMAGFVAATLHRGVPFIQIPTTLLAQVDSSIGGKVAVDHPRGKNLIGAFYQPNVVYIDTATLHTLPEAEFSSGMAEVIKYAAIMDKKLFSYLVKQFNNIIAHDSPSLHTIITRCCELKRYVVERDEKETDLRRILNFGHTIGHAVELLMNYTLSHGQAIAIGMAAETKIALALGMTSSDAEEQLCHLLRLYSLPTTIPGRLSLKKLFLATLQDKKAKAGVVHYTLLQELGKAKVGVPLTSEQALALYLQ